jgi:hypothetical protein
MIQLALLAWGNQTVILGGVIAAGFSLQITDPNGVSIQLNTPNGKFMLPPLPLGETYSLVVIGPQMIDGLALNNTGQYEYRVGHVAQITIAIS